LKLFPVITNAKENRFSSFHHLFLLSSFNGSHYPCLLSTQKYNATLTFALKLDP